MVRSVGEGFVTVAPFSQDGSGHKVATRADTFGQLIERMGELLGLVCGSVWARAHEPPGAVVGVWGCGGSS